jgi:hypothetical protein
VHDWAGFGAWEERHEELLREADERRLARGLREARKAQERPGEGYVEWPEGIEVRWGLLEDEPGIADILEFNGMPRWIAFEERHIVAEKDGKILAALRYWMEPERLLLGLLVTDPWAEERPLAVALYARAGELAREMGVGEILAQAFLRGDYPREAGYRRRGRREWRLDATRSPGSREEPPASGWRRAFALLGTLTVPFFGAFSAGKGQY